ncbi:Fungal transcriptional regulatory protein, N-terminal [Pleurostoma richardsiae]|uniref:Fungal transcriptional regulatory protein, N-terminal n=1 Tax=Pleurostoma richardsiae TaxID=41990 RepID=A0AA38RLX0_9PEZI|nr:Fungal transcriptional regulatory protein, N-terminal [Pleurostoma richardsiae]
MNLSVANSAGGQGSQKRLRLHACVRCRRSKRKCDGSRPCSTCTRYQHECQYDDAGTVAVAAPAFPTRSAVANHSTAQDLIGRSSTPAVERHSVTGGQSTAPPRRGYIAPAKGRFIEGHSSAAYPRSLGMSLGLPEPPRLHAFAYHLGIRKEPTSLVRARLAELLSWEQARTLIDIYISVVHPVFGFVDSDLLYRRSHAHWHGETQGLPYEAVVGGVVSLASLFSNHIPEELETEVVLHAKTVLEDPVVSRFPCLDLASGWILRTLYVRATGRPYVACLSSTISITIVEAMGLHQDANTTTLAGEKAPLTRTGSDEIRERVACTAQSLHVLLAYDYGRSIINIGPVPRGHVQSRAGDFTLQMAGLADAVLQSIDCAGPEDSRRTLTQLLDDLVAAPSDHDFVTLTKAELCFAVYRRLRMLDPGPQEAQVRDILDVGASAVPAARRLAAQKHPWWNIVNAMFQYVCVLLSVNSTKSLANLALTIETLEIVNRQFDSRLTLEALSTARLLTRAYVESEKEKISLLQDISGVTDQDPPVEDDDAMQYSVADLDLEAFLQPMPNASLFDMLDLL